MVRRAQGISDQSGVRQSDDNFVFGLVAGRDHRGPLDGRAVGLNGEVNFNAVNRFFVHTRLERRGGGDLAGQCIHASRWTR